jgi:hypothetical protein
MRREGFLRDDSRSWVGSWVRSLYFTLVIGMPDSWRVWVSGESVHAWLCEDAARGWGGHSRRFETLLGWFDHVDRFAMRGGDRGRSIGRGRGRGRGWDRVRGLGKGRGRRWDRGWTETEAERQRYRQGKGLDRGWDKD